MKKVYSLIHFVILLAISFPQVNGQDPGRKRCFTDEVYWEWVKKHPELLIEEQEREEFTRNYIATHNTPNQRTSSVVYIIPVVFHIIHQYGPENISDAKIHAALDQLNKDFRKLNSDTNLIINDFKQLAADCEIEFRLAQLDPAGNCTNGIERIYSPQTHFGGDWSKYTLFPGGWPRNKYLNIWTVSSFGTGHTTAAAYAYKPFASSPPPGRPDSVDGVISLYNYIDAGSRTLTHEIGHILNLNHCWGGTNLPGVSCGDDGVGDTPITKGWDVCPSSNFDVCTPGINENFQNFMEYSYCDRMFTHGQKARMVSALNNFGAGGGGRANLWQPANLIATGTDGSIAQICRPRADFYAVADHICSGDSVRFMDESFNTDSLFYEWTFPTGSPSTSTDMNPMVAFSTLGTHVAKLKVYNPAGADSITKTTTITVVGPPALVPDYVDSFEVANFPPGDGYLINDWGVTWERTTLAGYSGTASLKFPANSSAQLGFTDSYVTPSMNFTNRNNTKLTFRLAYARKDVAFNDALRIYTSYNCGKTWQLRRSYEGTQLTTSTWAGLGGFTPTSPADWKLMEGINVVTMRFQPNVRVKFELTSKTSNNLYIDDINITADPDAIYDPAVEALHFDVYPNPASGEFNVVFELGKSEHAEVIISDMIGREVMNVIKDKLAPGIHEHNISTTNLSKGIYLVTLRAGETTAVKKLVID